MELSNIEMAALAKLAGSKQEINPGTYSGSFSVRVHYTIKKGEAYLVKPTTNILTKAVIAKAAVMLGAQADNFFKALEKAAAEAVSNNNKLTFQDDERVMKRIEDIQNKVIAKLPPAQRSGVTSAKIEVEDIQRVMEVAEVAA